MEHYILGVTVALIGLLLHWVKRYVKKETKNSFVAYLTVEIQYTLASVITVIISASTLLEQNLIDFDSPASISKLLLVGYMIDSVLNKDKA